VISPIEETSQKAKAHGVHLHTKVLFALAIVSVLPLSVIFLLDGKLAASNESRDVFIDFISQSVALGPIRLHFFAVFMLAVFGASIAAAAIYMELIFVRPIRAFTAWVEAGRKEGFAKMNVMPEPHSKDVEQLQQSVAATLAFAYQTQTANRSLSSKRDELVVIAAHQLRTPLTGLKWAAQSLAGEKMSDSAAKTVGEIQSSIQRIGLIVDNIVASADIEEGRFGYSFSKAEPIEIVQKAITDLSITIKKRGLTVVFDPPSAVRSVYIDAYRMTTAIYNILENAVEYTPQGGTITVSLTDRETALELTVHDTGIGISQNDTKHLFTKFFRADNAKHMRPDGSGLGLYLAKHVVEAHGQKIWLESTEGVGTKITIPLPYEIPKA
jgi:signal transduction histidine kinase